MSANYISDSKGNQEVATRFLVAGFGICGVFRTGSCNAVQSQRNVAVVGRSGGFRGRHLEGSVGS